VRFLAVVGVTGVDPILSSPETEKKEKQMSTPSAKHPFPTAFEVASVAATLMLQPLNLGGRITYAAACKQALTLLNTAQIIVTEQAALQQEAALNKTVQRWLEDDKTVNS
jgi:hypothetical protein